MVVKGIQDEQNSMYVKGKTRKEAYFIDIVKMRAGFVDDPG